ncbi:InlB B-repeat-containing protein [Bifidobacterium adolescentis]|uniref:InlB B-repeat-containing protein n=1 Tax=Bifidobacterium adolescentis TaxID=1680 RepID=UPI0006BED3A4|nr:InlB B-repeat-containing protein [Bifidobacterium adolescentis]CUN60566.1 cell surface protein [Bifidobacterium adolescentis]
MGFFTRLLAGLVAASTLGAGLAGTAGAVDTTGATGDAKGVVKLASDDTSGLPDHLVNGDFSVNYKDQWLTGGWNWTSITPDGKYLNSVRNWNDSATIWKTVNGWDKTKFGWSSTQKDGTDNIQHKAGAVEIQYDNQADNVYAELCAYEKGTAIYQDIKTVPGTLYKIRLKHASLYSGYLDKMQVMVGTPGHEQAVEMTRTSVNGNGDTLNEKSTTIATKVSNTGESDRNHENQWETYEGTYLIPDGQTTTRFTFRSVAAESMDRGNLLDDIVFDKAYRLDYDKNASDASGQVPSNQRGKENTTQPAKTKTSGTVKTVADTNASLPDHLVNGDFSVNYHDQWKDSFGGWTSIDPNAGKTLHATSLPSGSSWKWTAINGWDKSKFGWTSTQKAGSNVQQKANAVELQYDDSTADNVYAELCAYEAGTAIYQDIRTVPGTLYKVRLKHASLNSTYLDKMQVMIGTPGHEQPVEMTRTSVNGHGDKLNEKSTTIATKVTNGNNRHHADQWETYEGTYLIPDGQTTTRFTFRSIDAKQLDYGNVLDGIVFDKAYRLDYDKNASDATGEVPSNQRGRENTTQPAKDKTSGSVKFVADDDVVEYAANGLPKQIVNSDFDHDWRNIVGQSKMSEKYNFANVDPAHGDVEISGPLNGKGEASKHWVHLNGFDANKFGWKSNQTDTRVDGRGGIVEIQRSRANDNMYAEITASQANTYLYQDIDTAHSVPTVYTVKLRYAHRNGTINSNEKIQILVGAPGHEQPVEMTRIASDRGNRLGEKSTTVNAPNTDGWLGSWDTFQGSVVVPAGQNVSRFTFKALGSIDGISGNLIDDVQFKLAYKLSYDKNANDASGSVPSDETVNTVKQAKARTTGTVRAVADRTASGLTVHDLKKGDIAPAQYGDFKFSTTDRFTAEQVTDVNDFTVKQNWDPTKEDQAYADKNLATMYQPDKNGASLILHHVGQWRDSSGTQRWLNAKITVNGQNLGSLVYYESQHKFLASYGKWDRHTSSRPYMDVTVDFLLDDGSTPQGLRGVTGFTDLDGGTSGYNEGVELVSGFDGAYVRSDAHLARFGTNGWAGATDENENNADAHGMKHYVGATFTGSSFRVRWSVASGQARGSGFQPVDSTIAYRLTYNKNAQDATGSIPSDTAANTTQPAKSETDGKVSDLVQRTTTHEDGSVTVKTIDTSTDVVSGCQVYYPAGQKITLATMAKDDDCWDSSMLSRPGHTQLGWNQDRNATQAQPEVTMVEGGMTVFAVWVGNPVLTYDTNKPSTWSGQMPSTPASVSVAYNTAAADGSGWAAGDTTKIRGYRFLGWYTGPQDNAGLYDWTRPLTGSVTVYAHWQRLQANVVYNANGGTGSHANTTGWQYSDVTIPGDTSKSFKRDKYVFKGWGTKPGKADVAYKDGSKVALQDKDITLYAQWQEVHENFVETGGIGLPIAIAGGVLLLMFGIGSTVMLTRRMNGHGMPDDE